MMDCTVEPNYKMVNLLKTTHNRCPIRDSKVHGANMGPTWGRQDPGGPHVGHMYLTIWDNLLLGVSYDMSILVHCLAYISNL